MPLSPPETALAGRTLALVDIPSPSHDEDMVYDYVRGAVHLPRVHDDGESLLYAKRDGKPLVLLAGHTDTVPAQDNLPGRIEDGAVHGLGATDMKGGLAVMIELGQWAAHTELAFDLGLLFFPREEVGPEYNPLPALFDAAPAIDEAALVVCLEPTDNTLELEPHAVDVDVLVFREVLSVTQIHGGIASNVIPARCEALLNFRYAPGRTMDDAEARVRELVGRELEIVDHAPAAHVPSRAPLVEKLQTAGGFDVQPKQAWTNVADFAARGLDAVNLGPGATRYAHAADEQVAVAELGRTYEALQRFLVDSV